MLPLKSNPLHIRHLSQELKFLSCFTEIRQSGACSAMGHGAGFQRGVGFSLLLQVLIAQDLVHQEGPMQRRVGVHGPCYILHAPSKIFHVRAS